MDNKYIFVSYDGRLDANIFWKGILYFWCKYSFTEGAKKKRKRIFSVGFISMSLRLISKLDFAINYENHFIFVGFISMSLRLIWQP